MMNPSGVRPNVWDLCRLCLKTDDTLLPVFDSNYNSQILCNKINICLAIQISTEDRLSQKICGTCLIKVNNFYEFKSSSSESQKVLERWLISISDEISGTENEPESSHEKEVNSRGSEESSSSSDSDDSDSSSNSASSGSSDRNAQEKSETESQKREEINILPVTEPFHSGNLASDSSSVIQEVSSLTTDIFSFQSVTSGGGTNKNESLHKTTALSALNSCTDNRKFLCNLCSYSTNLKCNLNKHIMRHKKAYKIKCNVCEKGFYSMSRYRQHTAEGVCSEHCILKCPECNKRCRSLMKLAEHVKIHDPGWTPTGFQCDSCGKMFLTKRGMTKHIAVHHSGVHLKCSICSKPFSTSESLDVHIKTKHVFEKTIYYCSTCGKSYATYKSLLAHEISHTGEQAFTCDICNKVFTQKASLVVHKRYHTGERPFKCSICDKGFVTNSILRGHEKTHKKK